MKRFNTLILIIIMFVATGCDSGGLSEEDYQTSVIRTLTGEGDNDLPDMATSLDITLKSAYCAEEEKCVFASEMEYFRSVAFEQMAYFGIYQQRICKDLTAPFSLQQDHETLCDSLGSIRSMLRSMEQSARLARDFLSSSSVDPSDNAQIVQARNSIAGLNQQMLQGRDTILESLRTLQTIIWLEGIADKIEIEIFAQ